jgi:hypothetical protein
LEEVSPEEIKDKPAKKYQPTPVDKDNVALLFHGRFLDSD